MIDQASLEVFFTQILPTMERREDAVLAAVGAMTQHVPDVTGKELADAMGTFTTSVRPLLTRLQQRGVLERTAIRDSRAPYEGRCHGYRLAQGVV